MSHTYWNRAGERTRTERSSRVLWRWQCKERTKLLKTRNVWAGRWQIPDSPSESSSYSSLKASFLIQRMQSPPIVPFMLLCGTTCKDNGLPQEAQVTLLLLCLHLHAVVSQGLTICWELLLLEMHIAWTVSIGGIAHFAPHFCVPNTWNGGMQQGSLGRTNVFSWNIFWSCSWSGRWMCYIHKCL